MKFIKYIWLIHNTAHYIIVSHIQSRLDYDKARGYNNAVVLLIREKKMHKKVEWALPYQNYKKQIVSTVYG